MFDIAIWVEFPKVLGITSPNHEKVCRRSLYLFENIDSKIGKIRRELNQNFNISDQEVEAYNRYLVSLTGLLIENWEEAVLSSLESIISLMEDTLSQKKKCFKKIRKTLACCEKIQAECKSGGTLKANYIGGKFEPALRRIEELEECFISKYFKGAHSICKP